MARPPQCSKCTGTMSVGFMVDKTDSGVAVARWIEGKPEKSFWRGLKLRGRLSIEIETWRCARCGFLESYATE